MTIRYYGGIKPHHVVGREQFASHNPATTWDDGGIATELAAQAVREAEDTFGGALDVAIKSIQTTLDTDLQAYGAHQVRDAVVDYVANGYLDAAVVDGKICVCFDASNDASPLRACFDLALLLRRATNEAINAGDGQTLQLLEALHNVLPASYQQPAPPPIPRAAAPQAPIGKVQRPKGVVRTERRAPQ